MASAERLKSALLSSALVLCAAQFSPAIVIDTIHRAGADAPLMAVRLQSPADVRDLRSLIAARLGSTPAPAPAILESVQAPLATMLRRDHVLAIRAESHLALIPLNPDGAGQALLLPVHPADLEAIKVFSLSGEIGRRIRSYLDSTSPADAHKAISHLFDGSLAEPAAPAAAAVPESGALWKDALSPSEARRLVLVTQLKTVKFFLTDRMEMLREWIERDKAESAGKRLAIEDFEAMWLDWRASGYSGRMNNAGFVVADRESIRAQATRFFDRHWGKDEASRAAFRRYMDRVGAAVPLTRPSNYRKRAFAAPFDLKALAPSELPARLDSLLTGEHVAAIDRHRAERQEGVIASFKEAALASVLEVNAGLPEGRKIVAVILFGSYASRQSTPGSDIDYQLMTQDGGTAAMRPFQDALARNWTENKFGEVKIEALEFTLPPSRHVLVEGIPEGYLVISPDPAAVRALSQDVFAPPPPTPWSRLCGWLFVKSYRAWGWGYLRFAEMREALKR